jgi:hypothetical protein
MTLYEDEFDETTVEITIDNLRELLESGKNYREIRREIITDLDLEEDDALREVTRDYYDKAAIELLGYKTAVPEIIADEYLILLKGDYVSATKTKVKKKLMYS